MWCDACRSTGAIHCAMPDECGNMLSATAAADNWKAWLDDLPLPFTFDPAIGRLQDFITGLTARIEAQAGARADAQAGVAQCCICGKKGLSTAEDGGPECELHDGRWVCSSECWEAASSLADPTGVKLLAELRAERDDAVELAEERLRGQHRLSNQLNDTARELNAANAALEAKVAGLVGLIRWAHETLWELNPNNYDHDEVCKANDAAVEVILGLAPVIGETHGYSPEWWAARAALAQTPTDPGDGWTWNEDILDAP